MGNTEELKDMIEKLSQFPHKQRKQNYQGYFIGSEYVPGSRDTLSRMKLMNIPENMERLSVLDIGCNLGSIAMECYRRGARKITGIDSEKDYIDCAKALAIHNGYSINFHVMNIMNIYESSKNISSHYKGPIDIIFMLSIYKHVKESMFLLLDKIEWKTAYVESHNAPELLETQHVKEMLDHMHKRNWNVEHIGTDYTRSPRIIFKVTK